MKAYDYPLKLSSARAWRTYVGGSRIDAIHGLPDVGDTQFPEEWIMSTVCARNAGREDFPNEGLSFLEGSETSLKALIHIILRPAAASMVCIFSAAAGPFALRRAAAG